MPKNANKENAKNLSVAILIGSFVIAVAIILNSFISLLNPKNPDPKDPNQVSVNISYVKINDSPVLGNENAPVSVVEYTDFDCPFCDATYEQILPGLKKDYIATGKIKFIFKSLPIPSLHPNAFRKTEAAYCARDQGGDPAFFAYYESLYKNFGFSFNLDDELLSIAQGNHLDPAQFRNCLTGEKFKDRINEEMVEGNLINSLGTPTWLIGKSNGDTLKDTVELNGMIAYPLFKTIIDKQLGN